MHRCGQALAGHLTIVMIVRITVFLLICSFFSPGAYGAPPLYAGHQSGSQDAMAVDVAPDSYREACPDYKHYSVHPQYVTDRVSLFHNMYLC